MIYTFSIMPIAQSRCFRHVENPLEGMWESPETNVANYFMYGDVKIPIYLMEKNSLDCTQEESGGSVLLVQYNRCLHDSIP